MKFLKISAMILIFVLLLAILSLVIFFIWASSGKIPSDRLSEIKRFESSGPSHTEGQAVFKIITANIGYLAGLANNRPERRSRFFFEANLKKVVRLFQEIRPDFVGFQEIDFHSHRSYYIDQLQEIASQSGRRYAALAVNWDKRYVPFPFWPPAVHFKEICSGQAVISSYPINWEERIVLPEIEEKPFFYRAFYLDRLAQVVKINLIKHSLVIINVHLEAFDPKTRNKQALKVLNIYRRYRDRYPIILLGDFNCVPPSASRESGFPDEPETDFRGVDAVGLFLREPGLKEAFLNSGRRRPEAETFSFPSNAPNRKLDYIFYSHRYITCLRAEVLRGDSSDHLPLLMEFCFRRSSD
jgi:endonuclease/exonuclease/phosphatase family metal-dependent hydrolase